MTENFGQYSRYYDLLYADKDYNAETAYIIDLIKRFHPGAVELVEFGSGTGIHASLLAEQDFQVTGVEPSLEMLNMARKHPGIQYVHSDIAGFSSNKKFDVALALFHVISYINDNEQLLECFSNVHRHLVADGIFIFDIWYTPAVLTKLPERRVKVMENETIQVERHATPEIDWVNNVINVLYDIRIQDKLHSSTEELSENHPMRHFGGPEIALLAKQTGFEVIHAEEFLTGKYPDNTTWGVTFILKKKNI